MPLLAKRAALGVLTVLGLALVVIGLWFAGHLGASGSATFTATPARDRVVVIEPSVVNRLNQPVQVTARAKDGAEVWIGRATPSDAAAVLGDAARTDVTGLHVRQWRLTAAERGTAKAPALSPADVWRDQATGTGQVRMTLDQENAPETVVVTTSDGAPAALEQLTVTVSKGTWFFQALLAALAGLIAAVVGAVGLWQTTRRRPSADEPAAAAPTPEVAA